MYFPFFMDGKKDSLSSRRRFIQSFPIKLRLYILKFPPFKQVRFFNRTTPRGKDESFPRRSSEGVCNPLHIFYPRE